MKNKIISKATDLFLKLGFKSVTMDDIACEMCISKKTIYKYFCNKEKLIEDSTKLVHHNIHSIMNSIMKRNFNAIAENFEFRKMFKDMFHSSDDSPIYQLKKHYPEIYEKVITREIEECHAIFKQNIEKGKEQGLYRKELPTENYIKFYYTLIFSINETTSVKKEALQLELDALEYHTRAMATQKGIIELEKQIINYNS